MAIEVGSTRTVCPKCGMAYASKKGNFPVSYGDTYKGAGYMHLCKKCIESMFEKYMSQCKDAKAAVRQMCRKLDLYWSDSVFESVAKKSSPHSVMMLYISKLNNVSFAGRSYDDTLLDEGNMWRTEKTSASTPDGDGVNVPITGEVIAFWGSGYSPEMYERLEQRRKYYMSQYPDTFSDGGGDSNIANDIYLRQLCNLEVSIASDAAAGKSIEKSVNAVNTIMGSLNLKPAQSKSAERDAALENTPMGVWLWRYEKKRPLPSEDELDDSVKDVYGIKKYIFTWMGHVFKIAGKKNAFSKLYEDEIARLRVERPEYDGDDESLIVNVYSDEGGDETGTEK